MRMLFIPAERYPTDRVRINVLFGHEMLSRGHTVDLVMQAEDPRTAAGPQSWHGSTLFVGPAVAAETLWRRLRRQSQGLTHDVRHLLRARGGAYDAIMISDKFVTGAIACLLVRKAAFIFWLTFPYPEADVDRARRGITRYRKLTHLRGTVTAWLLYGLILRRADHVFVQSDRMKRAVCAHGIDSDKVSPILTGFDLTGISPARRETREPPSGAVTVGYLGTLDPMRRLDVLVDMLAELRRDGVDARLLLVGDDNLRGREMIGQRAAELGMTRHVEITGFLPQPEALARMAGADVCVSPIDRSPLFDVGSPTKMIEYMALGMPVVANDHPEQRSILRESRAGVCVPWAPRHFARAVRWIMSRSAAERAAMGARGRAWVESNRTYAGIADEVERTCLDVIARKRESSSANRETCGKPPTPKSLARRLD
jgi:glycosyltransferase involved in cell wall biosynthesis